MLLLADGSNSGGEGVRSLSSCVWEGCNARLEQTEMLSVFPELPSCANLVKAE